MVESICLLNQSPFNLLSTLMFSPPQTFNVPQTLICLKTYPTLKWTAICSFSHLSRSLKLLRIQIIILFQTIRWCVRKVSDFTFTGVPQTPIHSEASFSGCQYTRSSTIIYNLTSTDTFTQLLCESGDTGKWWTGSVIQYINVSTRKCHILTCCEEFSLYLKWFY